MELLIEFTRRTLWQNRIVQPGHRIFVSPAELEGWGQQFEARGTEPPVTVLKGAGGPARQESQESDQGSVAGQQPEQGSKPDQDQESDQAKTGDGPFGDIVVAGKTFAFAGNVPDKEDLTGAITIYGGNVVVDITEDLDYLIIGARPGGKPEAAQAVGATLLAEGDAVEALLK